MWTYVYPAKYSDIKTEDERWKEERDRKLKEERNRSKDVSKEDGKESTSSECKLTPTEEARMVGKDPRPSVHVPVSSPLTQHQSYIPYMHGYSYSQSYDPNHPSYRAMPTVMMQNYPGREPRQSRGHLTLGGRPSPGCACVLVVFVGQALGATRGWAGEHLLWSSCRCWDVHRVAATTYWILCSKPAVSPCPDCLLSPQDRTFPPAIPSPRMGARHPGAMTATSPEPAPASAVNPALSPRPWTSCSSTPATTRANRPR